jgi:hypothetical protein
MIFAVGWFSVVFFGACGIAAAKKLFGAGEQIRIGPTGVRPSPGYQIIPWSEIADVTTWSSAGQKMIILHLRDPAGFPRQGMPAFLASANRMLTGGDIAISLTGTDRSFDEAMSAIVRFRI